MPVNILMPALSPTMEKGNLARWLKKEGDTVKAGDVIAEIETDKATMEDEAIDDGVLAKIVVPEGTADVPVNQLIAVLAAEGEDVKAAAAAAGKAPRRGEERRRRRSLPPRLHRQPRPLPQPRRGAGASAGRSHGANRVFASPLARRLAKDAGIDVSRIQGSGPHGRVIARDVEAAKSGKGLTRAGAAAGTPRRSRRRPTTRSARCSRPAATRSCRTTISAR